jgi:hypothetical protein
MLKNTKKIVDLAKLRLDSLIDTKKWREEMFVLLLCSLTQKIRENDVN